MLSLLRPRHVMPIHGEYRMLAAHAKLAREAGVPEERILIAENGSVVELARGDARLVDRVDAGVTFVDGPRVGDVRDVALRDRSASRTTAFSSSSRRWPPPTEATSHHPS